MAAFDWVDPTDPDKGIIQRRHFYVSARSACEDMCRQFENYIIEPFTFMRENPPFVTWVMDGYVNNVLGGEGYAQDEINRTSAKLESLLVFVSPPREGVNDGVPPGETPHRRQTTAHV